MKKLYLLPLIITLLLTSNKIANSQDEVWTLKVPPRGRNINAVEMFSPFKMAIAGGNPFNDSIRYFASTTTRGNEWEFYDAPLNPIVNDLVFTTENIAVMVGDAGDILKTYDAGLNWESLPTPGNTGFRNFTGVHFFNTESGIVVGGNLENDAITTILRTTNGGNEWSIISDNLGAMLNDVDFIDNNTGISVGNGGLVLKTTDGGSNWNPITTIPGGAANRNFKAVHLIDNQTYIIVGGNLTNDSIQTIIKTTDGGTNWAIIKDNPSPMLNGIHFYNNTNGYAVGNNGVVLKSTDAGENWINLNLPDVTDAYTFNNVQFLDSENGIVVGNGGAVFIAGDTNVVVPILPIAQTFPADFVTALSARISGQINARNTSTSVYFDFGTTQNYDDVFTPNPNVFNDSVPHYIIFMVNGLEPETNYNYRIVAFNDNDTVYGGNQQFTTAPILPEVRTENGILLEDDRLVLTGKANAKNSDLEVLFQFGTTTSYGQELSPSDNMFSDDEDRDVMYVLTDDLTEDVYHFRLIGLYESDTIFGEDKQVFVGTSTIPNFNFELWDTTEYSSPDAWLSFGNVSKVSDATDGSFAVLLESGYDPFDPEDNGDPGVVLQGEIGDEGPIGGVPYTERPDSLSFSAKYDISVDDPALVLLFFKKNGEIFSENIFQITGSSNGEFETLKFKIDYSTTDVPDSLIIAFTSSNFMQEELNLDNHITIDNVQFLNATNQISNNSFENWSDFEFINLTGWNSNLEISTNGYVNSVIPSTDAFFGDLAGKLQNNTAINLTGTITTGNTDEQTIPSFPVAYRHQQLTGFYKAQPDNDTINIGITLFKNGESFGNGHIQIVESEDSYRPFVVDISYNNETDVPDSATIHISTFGSNSEALGETVLTVDNLNFDRFLANSDMILSATEAISLVENINLYPNPTANYLFYDLQLSKNVNEKITINVFDLNGKQVLPTEFVNTNGDFIHQKLDVSILNKGVYLILFDFKNQNTFKSYKFIKN